MSAGLQTVSVFGFVSLFSHISQTLLAGMLRRDVRVSYKEACQFIPL